MITDGNHGKEIGLSRLRSELSERQSLLLRAALGLGALALAGCAASEDPRFAEAAKLYGPVADAQFNIPAVDVHRVSDPRYFRATVDYDTPEAPGTIIIDPKHFFLYRVEGGGKATRYGVNVGRKGFLWSGEVYVGRKAEWPIWTPPKEMIARRPEAKQYAGGMKPGLDNPLGARTLYLYRNGAYTVFTIYSTSDPESIGNGETSGCTGLLTQDMLDLYARTPVKTKVIMLPG